MANPIYQHQVFASMVLLLIAFESGNPESYLFRTSGEVAIQAAANNELVQPENATSTADSKLEDARRQKQLWLVGTIALGLLAVVFVFFCYFKLNLATRGFYSGRLQLLVAVLLVLLGGLIFWLIANYGI